MSDESWILTRFAHLPTGTLGVLQRPEGARTIYTVERPWLNNTPFTSCIPEGIYVIRPFSGKRWQNVLEVEDVPGRYSILFHPGNFPSDLQGCIAPGFGWVVEHNAPSVRNSREAMDDLLKDFSQIAGQLTLRVTSQRSVV